MKFRKKCVIRASILATVLAGATVGSLALAGEFSSGPSDSCTVQLTGYGSEMVVNLQGSTVTPADCNKIVAATSTSSGSGFTTKQVSSIPSDVTQACSETENGITATVYGNNSLVSGLGTAAICAKLKG